MLLYEDGCKHARAWSYMVQHQFARTRDTRKQRVLSFKIRRQHLHLPTEPTNKMVVGGCT